MFRTALVGFLALATASADPSFHSRQLLTVDGTYNSNEVANAASLPMYTAGNSKKSVIGNAYYELDCASSTMCVSVVLNKGYKLEQTLDNIWVKDANHPTSTNLKYETKSFSYFKDGTQGWEGCFVLPASESGDRLLEFHSNYDKGETMSTGKLAQGAGKAINLCPANLVGEPEVVPTDPKDTPLSPGNTEGTGVDPSTPREGGSFGDPHVKTWTGHVFDFHGACDIVLAHVPAFNNEQGLDLHVRMTMRDDWSYISEAALKIGNDVLQVGTNAEYYLNGVKSAALPLTVGGFAVKVVHKTEKTHRFDIDLKEQGKIRIKVYNEFLGVNFQKAGSDFQHATGIMGEFETGALLSRNGQVVADTNVYGQEWQVHDDELQLFQEKKGPQYPEACEMPVPKELSQRRLAESMVSFEDAAKACADWDMESKEACIYDVMATGDLEMAQGGAM
ncbi:hypothetical protein FisN_14Hh013 [Fistulifera solaris]|uniref:VWFD domain-containing protein n=1 Tax=Fistulifera solaris TaxID=1519565 RepID=A0A1Z5K801_FISSO|nr:hypothetical protein FisN_14Hh013 [Fistulifera solaris]|eukprot:GAX22400.1 hypothetical protein FisN_14Hh013 [Fistulifera solaris]